MIENLNDWILELAGHSWAYPVVGAMSALDAFFPPVPSESAIVALAAMGGPAGVNLWLLGLVGAIGAIIGDLAAYLVGRSVGTERFGWQRRPQVRKIIDGAGRQMSRRGGVLIFTARYIPVGRIAVMSTAGATGMRLRTFLLYSSIGCSAWAAWCITVGAVAGQLFGDQPLLAAAVGVVVAVTVGLAVDRIMARRSAASPEPELVPEPAVAAESACSQKS
ncbi:DedA family protein [Dermacoccaceae bacterium W4C1]